MKLRIANLGAVKEATIDLSRKLTVFCGPNGTGKTWVAYVINGFFDETQPTMFSNGLPNLMSLIAGEETTIEISPDSVFEILKNRANDLAKLVQHILPVAVERQQDLFGIFQTDIVDNREDFLQQYFKREIQTRLKYFGLNFSVSKATNSNEIRLRYKTASNQAFPTYQGFLSSLIGHVVYSLASYPLLSSTILPVERNSVYTFNKELGLQKSAIMEKFIKLSYDDFEKESRDFLTTRNTRYPKAVRDALEVAEDLSNITKTASSYYDFGVEVEQSLLQGKIIVGGNDEVNFSPNKAAGKSFSFQLSSSAVKTLSSLIVYLKYQAKLNDLLIIDEPELNLHPDNQILLARVFARMINQGLRLLISTHSDYIVRELNNLIMLSSDEPALRQVAKDYGYREDEKIDRRDIGVYLFNFKDGSEHVVVEPVEVADNGFEVATIEDTINRLNAVSEDLFYYMKHGYKHREAEQA